LQNLVCDEMLKTDSFLEYLKFERNYSDRTVTEYRTDLREFDEFLKETYHEELSPKEVSTEQIREWIMALMDQKMAASSVNRKLSALRSFYRFLLKKGELTVDPTRKITGPKKNKPLPVFLKESDMDKVLDEIDYGDSYEGCRDHLILQMFYETGMRRAELIGLDDKDIDLGAGVIRVTGKRNKQRLIPFGEELRKSIVEFVGNRDKAVPVHSEAFFVRKNGERLYPDLVGLIVKKHLSKVVTVKKKSPHVLRHTFATTMLNHQAGLKSIQELLGHQSLKTTEIYTHTTFEELKQVYNQAHPRAEEKRR